MKGLKLARSSTSHFEDVRATLNTLMSGTETNVSPAQKQKEAQLA